MREITTGSDRQWSALKACLLGWLLPATSAKRTTRLKLRDAFVMHIASILLIIPIVAAIEAFGQAKTLVQGSDPFFENLGEVINEINRDPVEFSIILFIAVTCVEIGYIVTALALMAWGGADERMRDSYVNALRQLWLRHSHVVIASILAGTLTVPVVQAQMAWFMHDMDFQYHDPPSPPENASRDSPEWKAYEAKLDAYYEEQTMSWEQRWARRPWLVKYGEEILACLWFGTGLWVLWALLRAIGANRNIASIERPPMCETCGYNLTAASMEGRCPECGRPVVESLGSHVRPGTLWQRRRGIRRLDAWWQCTLDAISRPEWFGRQIQTLSYETSHRWILVASLIAVFVTCLLILPLSYLMILGRNPITEDPEVLWTVGPLAGYMSAVALLLLSALAAGLVGIWYRLKQKRNLMSATIQIASYLSWYLVLWNTLSLAIGTTLIINHESFWPASPRLFIPPPFVVFGLWALSNLVLFVVYVILIARATVGAQYANR